MSSPKKKADSQSRGFGAQMMGAEDPRSSPPSFSAMMFAIFAGLVSTVVLIIATQTTHWFVANTGAHTGLLVMIEKDWRCGDLCPSVEKDLDGGFKTAGEITILTSLIAGGLMAVSVLIHCVNMTEYGNRQKALCACTLIDAAAVVLCVTMFLQVHLTTEQRNSDEPDSNGVVPEWSPGASYFACGLSTMLAIAGAVASMVAKPAPEDEGMKAALELASPEVKYKKQNPQGQASFAPKY